MGSLIQVASVARDRLSVFLGIFLVLMLPACGKRAVYVGKDAKVASIPLFIEMPQNVLVFDNLSSLLYGELWDHFDRIGYDLQTHAHGNYRLATKIRRLDETKKFISPDVLTYGVRVRLEILCTLFTSDGHKLSSHVFTFYQWLSKSKNPVLHNHFFKEQYRALLRRAAPKIDHYVRRLLWKREKKS